MLRLRPSLSYNLAPPDIRPGPRRRSSSSRQAVALTLAAPQARRPALQVRSIGSSIALSRGALGRRRVGCIIQRLIAKVADTRRVLRRWGVCPPGNVLLLHLLLGLLLGLQLLDV